MIFNGLYYTLCTVAGLLATTSTHPHFPLEPLLDSLHIWLAPAWVAYLTVTQTLTLEGFEHLTVLYSDHGCCTFLFTISHYWASVTWVPSHLVIGLTSRQLLDVAVYYRTSEHCCSSFAIKWVPWSVS